MYGWKIEEARQFQKTISHKSRCSAPARAKINAFWRPEKGPVAMTTERPRAPRMEANQIKAHMDTNSICICLFCLSEWDSGDWERLLRSRRPHHFLPADAYYVQLPECAALPPSPRSRRFLSAGAGVQSFDQELLHGNRARAAAASSRIDLKRSVHYNTRTPQHPRC